MKFYYNFKKIKNHVFRSELTKFELNEMILQKICYLNNHFLNNLQDNKKYTKKYRYSHEYQNN